MNVNEVFYITNVLCYRAFEKILAFNYTKVFKNIAFKNRI